MKTISTGNSCGGVQGVYSQFQPPAIVTCLPYYFPDTGSRQCLLEDACKDKAIDLTLRMQEGYDHSHFFISTFMAGHIEWHAQHLIKS